MGIEFELNANTGLLLYSDYPELLDVTSASEYENSRQKYKIN